MDRTIQQNGDFPQPQHPRFLRATAFPHKHTFSKHKQSHLSRSLPSVSFVFPFNPRSPFRGTFRAGSALQQGHLAHIAFRLLNSNGQRLEMDSALLTDRVLPEDFAALRVSS